MTVAVDVLVAAGVLAEAVCCAGVALGRGPLDRLHYAGAAGTLGPVLFAAGVLVAQGWTTGSVLALITVGFVLAAGPVLVVATARVIATHGETEGGAPDGEKVEVAG